MNWRERFGVQLVDEWRHAWKWLQVQLGAVLAIAPELYEQADVFQSFMSEKTFHHFMALLGIAVIINSIRHKQKAP